MLENELNGFKYTIISLAYRLIIMVGSVFNIHSMWAVKQFFSFKTLKKKT